MFPELQAKVLLLKAFQRQRFARTYEDLLDTPRYGAAARFFLDELYGPTDFTRRDAQFARVVPALVRLFPPEVVETVLPSGPTDKSLSSTPTFSSFGAATNRNGSLDAIAMWRI